MLIWCKNDSHTSTLDSMEDAVTPNNNHLSCNMMLIIEMDGSSSSTRLVAFLYRSGWLARLLQICRCVLFLVELGKICRTSSQALSSETGNLSLLQKKKKMCCVSYLCFSSVVTLSAVPNYPSFS